MIEMGKNQKQKNFHGCLAVFVSEFIPLRLVFTSDGVGVVIGSVELMIK